MNREAKTMTFIEIIEELRGRIAQIQQTLVKRELREPFEAVLFSILERLKTLEEGTKETKKELMILKRRHELHVEGADVTTLASESKICTIKGDIRKLKEISSLHKNTIAHLLKTTRDLQRLVEGTN